MSNIGDRLSEIFELEQQEEEKQKALVVAHEKMLASNELESDFDLAKRSIRGILENAAEALEESIVIAKETEKPEAYKAVATLLEVQRKAAQALLDSHKRKKEVDIMDKPVSDAPGSITNQQNNIFVGNTKDLIAALKANGSLPVIENK